MATINLNHSSYRIQEHPVRELLKQHGSRGYAVLWRIEELLAIWQEDNKSHIITQVAADLHEEHSIVLQIINTLIQEGLIQENDGIISSDIVTSQISKAKRISKVRSNASKVRYAKVEEPEEIKKPVPRKKKEFIRPTPKEITEYGLSKGHTLDGQFIFDWYEKSKWKDANSRQMKNWKLKVFQVWCKEENKIKKMDRKDWFGDDK